MSYAGAFNGVLFVVGSGCSGLCGVLFCPFILDGGFLYFGGDGVKKKWLLDQ